MHASSKSTSRHRTVQALPAVLLAVALALTGCSAGGGSDSGGDSDKAAGAAREDAYASGNKDDKGVGGGQADKSGRKKPPKLADTHIIRTATLTVRVKDVPKALDEARAVATDAGGVVGDETTDRDGRGHDRSRIVLRVPQDRYEEVLTSLEGTGKLIERKAKAQDVTEQVVDVESRIKSQRASVARVRELMDKATKLSDVVTLEGELSTRQSELEALLAQQSSLKDRTSMSTITLSLSETAVKKADADDDDPTFVDALSGGWSAFVTMLRWLAVALGAILPFAAVAALLFLLWQRLVRPRLPRRPAVAAAREGDDD
ncbi:DUF4349 domain-containing protein [Streptomyces sp. BA2]|uniref:DUF4349 domain-containing protein n=1 Tax=Streptomyces sp. BA2 TaxID=436595 RepID=UPI001321C042|nr:DUF4349 domain-containing protein [Streptomyces sp. BA2]MWA14246.1 DUF4349 domain-containing protein [Streptomyces sp. BA2]